MLRVIFFARFVCSQNFRDFSRFTKISIERSSEISNIERLCLFGLRFFLFSVTLSLLYSSWFLLLFIIFIIIRHSINTHTQSLALSLSSSLSVAYSTIQINWISFQNQQFCSWSAVQLFGALEFCIFFGQQIIIEFILPLGISWKWCAKRDRTIVQIFLTPNTYKVNQHNMPYHTLCSINMQLIIPVTK